MIGIADYTFWKLLDEAEKLCEGIQNASEGAVEQNVVVEGLLSVGKGSVVKDGSRIEGNVFIGENCVIGPNAYLRKSVIIGDNCHVANSEIKNSVILHDSNVPHYSYVGDSVIGANVNLGAGTKIANLRFDDKNISVAVAGRKTDSGRRKLGCLIGNNSKLGINSGVNCGVIIGNGCFVRPGKVVEKNLEDGAKLD